MKGFPTTDNEDAERLSEAAEYLLLLDEGADNPDDSAEAFRWVASDQRNLRAFRRIHAFRSWLFGLDRESKSALAQELLPESMQWASSGRPRLRRWTYAAAAAVLVGVLGLASILNRDVPVSNPVSREYATAPGATRMIALPDGTHITMAGASALRVAYQAQKRAVTLVRGEAYFQVHHDPDRPFTVQAGTLQVEDLGTVFDIRRDSAEVTVSVAHGRVEVHQAAGAHGGAGGESPKSSATSVRLGAGHQVTVLTATKTLRITPIGGANVASWRHGRLRFKNTRLSAVVKRLNRYSAVPISLAGGRVGTRRFTGTIFVKNIRDWLHAACSVFNLRERHEANGAIVLYDATVSPTAATPPQSIPTGVTGPELREP